MRKITIIFLFCLLLMGCATSRTLTYDYGAKKLTEENTNKIMRGKTTKQEVLIILGNPTMKSNSALGEMWIYTRSITQQKLTLFMGWAYDPNASKTSSMSITFDEKGVVKDFSTFEMGTMMTGTVEYK